MNVEIKSQKIIHSSVPFSMETLREVISDKDAVIRVDLSELSDKVTIRQALIYLSNLDVKTDIVFRNEETLEVLSEYLELPVIVESSQLSNLALMAICHVKGIQSFPDIFPDEWIDEKNDVIHDWIRLLDSALFFILDNLSVKIGSLLEDNEFFKPEQDPDDIESFDVRKYVNYVQCFSSPLYPISITKVISDNAITDRSIYEGNIYKGRSLFHYWDKEENELNIILKSMTSTDSDTVNTFFDLKDILDRSEVLDDTFI